MHRHLNYLPSPDSVISRHSTVQKSKVKSRRQFQRCAVSAVNLEPRGLKQRSVAEMSTCSVAGLRSANSMHVECSTLRSIVTASAKWLCCWT